MKYLVSKSIVQVIGNIWQPDIGMCGQEFTLATYAMNARNEEGQVTRESLQYWLDTHAGDFASITDFYASIEDGPDTIEIPWADEESEMIYNRCVWGD